AVGGEGDGGDLGGVAVQLGNGLAGPDVEEVTDAAGRREQARAVGAEDDVLRKGLVPGLEAAPLPTRRRIPCRDRAGEPERSELRPVGGERHGLKASLSRL